jgi:hypothetical protein
VASIGETKPKQPDAPQKRIQDRDVQWRLSGNGGKRFFAWCYYAKLRDRRDRGFPSQIHRIRDGLSFLTLAPALFEAGYQYGGAILNIPAAEAQGNAWSANAEYGTGDVLLFATRPPLDDPQNPKKGDRWIDRSRYATEQVVFKAFKENLLEHCSRTKITLKADLSCRPKNATIFRSIEFSTKQGGQIAALRGERLAPWRSSTPPTGADYAAGYLLSIPNVGEQKFRLLAAFSSGGTETLWWSWLLMHRHRKLLSDALAAKKRTVWLGLFAIPKMAPTFLSFDASAFALSSRKTEPTWPEIIQWSAD